MKVTLIAAALGLCLASAESTAQAQPTVTEHITIGSMNPTPESPAIARKEAAAELAQARYDCRKERDADARKSCMAAARDDCSHMMAMAGSGSHGVHASTKQAS
jgi:hypothetical protein